MPLKLAMKGEVWTRLDCVTKALAGQGLDLGNATYLQVPFMPVFAPLDVFRISLASRSKERNETVPGNQKGLSKPFSCTRTKERIGTGKNGPRHEKTANRRQTRKF